MSIPMQTPGERAPPVPAPHRRYLFDQSGLEGGRNCIVASLALCSVFREALEASDRPGAVQLTGEPGTGKRILGYYLHRTSTRGTRPLAALDLPAIPERLREAALFGDGLRRGALEAAAGGTLFLREVGLLPASAQERLVRAWARLDGPRSVARLMASSSADLLERALAGRFHWELLARLQAVVLHVPPLRERPEDVEALAGHFLKRLGAGLPLAPRQFSLAALGCLLRYRWPGNAGELRFAVRHALLACTGETIRTRHLPEHIRRGGPPPRPAEGEAVNAGGLRACLLEAQAGTIRATLARHHGAVAMAACELHLSSARLRKCMDRIGIAGERA